MGHKRKKHYGQKNRGIATPSCGTVRNDKQERIATSPAAPRNDMEGRKAHKAGGAPEFEVRIRISKRPKVDHYSGDIEATSTTALIEALAVLIQKAADIIGAPTERVYAVVATLLFAESEGMEDVSLDQMEGE